jgi:L-lactate dehydrogenase complex protein LldG
MSEARDAILGAIRRALKRGPLAAAAAAELSARLSRHPRNLIPARATALDEEGRIDLFVKMAEEADATLSRVESLAAVPAAIAQYLARHNLAPEAVIGGLDEIPWGERPLIALKRGRVGPEDAVGLAPAFAAVAESGTLMLISGSETPTSLNFLPDTHIVVLRRDQVVASYEDGFDRLRALAAQNGEWPRTVNFITGPSRTGDIEQKIELGAHGPRRLHIVLVEAPEEVASA